MGSAAHGGKGFQERATGSGERPIGATSCRQQHNQASCQTPPLPLWSDGQPSNRFVSVRNCIPPIPPKATLPLKRIPAQRHAQEKGEGWCFLEPVSEGVGIARPRCCTCELMGAWESPFTPGTGQGGPGLETFQERRTVR